MTALQPLENLNLSALRFRCAEETNLFQARKSFDPQYCFEIFRRAVCNTSQQAWDAVFTQYQGQVSAWVHRNAMFPMVGEEAQYFVNRAFERMWGALTPEKWDNFPDLKSLLRYLQMCAHSVLVDYARQKEHAHDKTSLEERKGNPIADPQAAVEDSVLTEQRRQDLWQLIQDIVKDEREYQAIYGKFALGLKSAAIAKQFPDLYSNVKDVYRVTEAAMERLRRNASLGDFLGDL